MPDVQLWWSSLLSADRSLLRMLDEAERDRISALQRPADRGRSMVGAALLRSAVADDLDCRPEEVVLDRTCVECGEPHGRPRVIGPLPGARATPPRVSVSHSGHLVVAALCRTHEVGVDVQRIDDVDDGVDVWEWVSAEARLKAGIPDGIDAHPTCRITAPLQGYAAAVAVAGPATSAGQPLPGPAVIERHWHPPAAPEGRG